MLELDSLSEVGSQLQITLRGALESIPNAPQRPQALAKTLRVNKNLTSRLCAALRTQDPLATMSLVPGPVPLRQMLKAASALGADRERVKLASDAIEQFEAVIRDEFDDRAGLDAVLGTVIPEMRSRHELAAKQAVFRGMASIKGVSVDVSLVTFIEHPSPEDPDRVASVMLGGYYGLRRIRPGAPIQFTAQLGQTTFPFREQLPGEVSEDPLLREFCRPSDLNLERVDYGDLACYQVVGNAIGRSSAIDMVLSEYYPKHLSNRGPAPGRIRHFDATIEYPCKTLIFDMLIHKDVWPGATFDLCIYDTTVKGMVDPNDPNRRKDQLLLSESIQPIGKGIEGLRSSRVPQYPELLKHVFSRFGWDGSQFISHRCTISYPVYGSQICLQTGTKPLGTP